MGMMAAVPKQASAAPTIVTQQAIPRTNFGTTAHPHPCVAQARAKLCDSAKPDFHTYLEFGLKFRNLVISATALEDQPPEEPKVVKPTQYKGMLH